MKTLTLLRHAKSGWDDKVARDVDRPLNGKGKRAAATVGQHWRHLRLTFDHVVASPAVRVAETIAELAAGYGESIVPVIDRRIYLASAVTLLDVIHELPVGAEHVLMIGHNPGLEDLVLMLVPDKASDHLRDTVEEKFPTASTAEMTFEGEWVDVAQNKATLTRFIRPRDLDAALGPDRE